MKWLNQKAHRKQFVMHGQPAYTGVGTIELRRAIQMKQTSSGQERWPVWAAMGVIGLLLALGLRTCKPG